MMELPKQQKRTIIKNVLDLLKYYTERSYYQRKLSRYNIG